MHVAYKDEWLVILMFVGLFVALYGSAVFLLMRRYLGPKAQRANIGPMGKVVLALCLVGFAAAAYAMLVEPYRLEITHIELPIERLPNSASPIRIVQISDLHCDRTARLEPQLPKVIRDQHPDLILFTGDATNSSDGYDNFFGVIRELETIAPVLAVRGDWDYTPQYGFDVFTRAGLAKSPPLTWQYTVHGAKLCVIAVEGGESAVEAVAKAPKNLPLILMTHAPDSDAVLSRHTTGIDLICCGHTHGGQIAIPGYGALITQSKTRREYSSGLNKIGNTYIYTNRGIGMEGHFPRVRFGAPPEVTVFELVSNAKPKT